MASHLSKYAVLGTSLQPPVSELEVLEAINISYLPWVQKLFITSKIKTIQECTELLNKLEAIEGHSSGTIGTGYMHVAGRTEGTTAMAGLTK